MRNAFADEITLLAAEDERIVLLSGDIGNRLFDTYKGNCPTRFFNCGVAEANMTSMAAGMALCGLRPFTYTIASFNTTRCFEQIRVDLCYHNLPVVIVGVGAGLSYAGLGPTHHACEDIALLRVLPNMTVICPGDAVEVRLAVRAALQHRGPIYIRLGKKNEPIIHHEDPPFQIGRAIVVREGSDICLLSTGNILPVVLDTVLLLEKVGVSAQVVSMHTVKPIDTDLLAAAFANFEAVVTVEEHTGLGGFGSSVAEWLVDNLPQKGRLYRFDTSDGFLCSCGNQENARKLVGLSSEHMAEELRAIVRGQVHN
jgi:transketolase